jgi:hypothetical protein
MNMKDISRAERSRVLGWYLRINHGGEEYRKLFSGSKYDGKEAALLTAIEHRDQYLEDDSTPEKLPFRPNSIRAIAPASIGRKPGQAIESIFMIVLSPTSPRSRMFTK